MPAETRRLFIVLLCVSDLQPLSLLLVFLLSFLQLCVEALTDFSQLGSLSIIICFLLEKELLQNYG